MAFLYVNDFRKRDVVILQTGQRTDIPAFYGQWLINRVQAGFVDVRNPYNPNQITRYMINHNTVDGISFCLELSSQMQLY